jgi:ATP-dependent DNA helicase RecG
VPTERWPRAVRSIARAVRRKGRVFVVCPAVGEEGEKGGVVRVHEALAAKFRCGLVHGRLATGERQRVLQAFRDGALDVLVGTTVLEVGVDVPDATLVVVVAADRFGIATLHQLRGRVGRGAHESSCVLLYRAPLGPLARARLNAIRETGDGFAIAERDLELRGPGELLGTRQTGLARMRVADLVRDADLLPRVQQAAEVMLARYPDRIAGLTARWIGDDDRYGRIG